MWYLRKSGAEIVLQGTVKSSDLHRKSTPGAVLKNVKREKILGCPLLLDMVKDRMLFERASLADHHFIKSLSMVHPLTGFLLSSNCRKQRQLRLFSTSLYSSPGEAGKDHFCYVFRLFPLEILRLKRPLAFPHSPVVTDCKFGLLRKYQNKNRFERRRMVVSKFSPHENRE